MDSPRATPALPGASAPGIRASLRRESLTRFVAELSARQHGLISLAQAVAMGMSASAVQRRAASGAWEVVLPGVYRIRGAPVTFAQQVMSAVLWAGPGAVASHMTAGVLWRFDGMRRGRIEVTLPRGRGKRHDDVTIHRPVSLSDVDRAEVDGILCTTAARAVLDIAGMVDEETLEIVLESGFRMGLYRESFLRWRLSELGRKGRPGCGRLLTILDERGKGAAPLEYPLEVKAWRLLKKSRLPPPVRQHWIQAGSRRFRLDFAWPDCKVAIECDGYDPHSGAVAFRRDRAKLAEVGAAGWRVIPVTWQDVTRRPEWVIESLRAALAAAA